MMDSTSVPRRTTDGDSRSNNFTSDFDNVSPCVDEQQQAVPIPPGTSRSNAVAGTATAPGTTANPNNSATANNNEHGANTNGDGNYNADKDLMAVPEGPIGVDHVNWLLSACGISQERTIDSLRQCSSSLFALLFQRIFNCTISDLELEPNTQEKRLWNIERVLEELQLYVSTDLSYISAQHIVALNEEHISELIRVFFELVVSIVLTNQNNTNGTNQQGGLTGQQLPEDDASQADSVHKTYRLVSNWKREVVHPLRDVAGASSSNSIATSASKQGKGRRLPSSRNAMANAIGDLHARMSHLDQIIVTPTPEKRHQMRGGPNAGGAVGGGIGVGKENGGGSGGAGTPLSGRRRRATSVAPPTAAAAATKRGGSARPADGKANRATVPTANTATVPRRALHHAAVNSASSSAVVRGGGGGGYADPYATTATTMCNQLFPPSTYSLAKTINTEARDIKIQQLKTMRFIADVHQAMRSTIVKAASEQQRDIASTVKAQQAAVRRDARDMMAYARDENERYKQAYECILMSARNDVRRCRDVIDPKTVQIYERNAKATRAASLGVKASIRAQRDMEDRRVERYYDAITMWRKGTVACI